MPPSTQRVLVLLLTGLLVALALPGTASALPYDRNDAISIVTSSVIDTMAAKNVALGFALQSAIAPGETITDEDAVFMGAPADSSWFVWIDADPLAEFAHDTRYVLVSGVTGAITMNAQGGFWPQVGGVEHYRTDADRSGPDLFYTGPSSPKPSVDPWDQGLRMLGEDSGVLPAAADNDKWAIIVAADDTNTVKRRAHNVRRARRIFKGFGVPDSNVVVYNNPTKAGFNAGIDSLQKNCAKVYVYWTGHGRGDSLFVKGPEMTGKEFACKIKELNAKETCVIFGTCHSGAFLNDLFAKGVNGFHISAADSGRLLHTWNPGTGPFVGGFFEHFWEQCINTGLSGFEAFQWAADTMAAYIDSLNAANGWGLKQSNPKATQIGVFTKSGQEIELNAADGCSTICLQFSTDGDATSCANASVYCQKAVGADTTWVFKNHWNWNSGKTRYFHAFATPGATGKYKVAGHSNKYPMKFRATWLATTDTLETPDSALDMPAHSIGTIRPVPTSEGGAADFNESLGAGGIPPVVGGIHAPGFALDQFPRFLGANYADGVQIQIPLLVDLARPWLYVNGDPVQGYAADTFIQLELLDILDPLGFPIFFAQLDVLVQQGSAPPVLSSTTAQRVGDQILVEPVIIPGGQLYPAPLTLSIQVSPLSSSGLGRAASHAPATVEFDAIILHHTTTGAAPASVPGNGIHPVSLLHAFPNPFRSQANVRFALESPGVVELSVLDVQGRMVRALLHEELPAGIHQLTWDGRSDAGQQVRSGVYFMRLRHPEGTQTRKILRTP